MTTEHESETGNETETETGTETLDERVRELESEIARLEALIKQNSVKLEESGGRSSSHGQFDHHDSAVLECLSGHEGQTVDRSNLKQLYREQTNLRRQSTIRSRMNDLVASELFEKAGANLWRFVGGDGGGA